MSNSDQRGGRAALETTTTITIPTPTELAESAPSGIHTCTLCGTQWRHGADGSHSCTDALLATVRRLRTLLPLPCGHAPRFLCTASQGRDLYSSHCSECERIAEAEARHAVDQGRIERFQAAAAHCNTWEEAARAAQVRARRAEEALAQIAQIVGSEGSDAAFKVEAVEDVLNAAQRIASHATAAPDARRAGESAESDRWGLEDIS